MKSKKDNLKKNLIIAAAVVILYTLILVADYRIDCRRKEEAYANMPLSTEMSLLDEADLSIIYDLDYSNGTVSGVIGVQNNGKAIENVSGGAFPVCVGISLVDADGNIICQDFCHMNIKEGTLEQQERADNQVLFDNTGEYEGCAGMRIAIVQESIAWFDDTAVIWMFE